MKASSVTLAIILALSLGVWTLFYLMPAGEPLTPPETLVVVGFCSAVVLVGRWMWSAVRKPGGDNAGKS